MKLRTYLEQATTCGASDIFITVGFPVSAKINGELTPLTDSPLSHDEARELVHSVMEERYIHELNETRESIFCKA